MLQIDATPVENYWLRHCKPEMCQLAMHWHLRPSVPSVVLGFDYEAGCADTQRTGMSNFSKKWTLCGWVSEIHHNVV